LSLDYEKLDEGLKNEIIVAFNDFSKKNMKKKN
jgi:hypothetical protein